MFYNFTVGSTDLVIVSKIYKSSPTKKFFCSFIVVVFFYFRATQSGIKLNCLGFNFILSTLSLICLLWRFVTVPGGKGSCSLLYRHS